MTISSRTQRDTVSQSTATGPEALHDIERQVSGFGRFRKRWSVFDGLARFVIIGPGAMLAWFLVDWIIGLPSWPLLLTFVVAVILTLGALIWKLVPPLFRRVRVEREALAIEKFHGELDNQIIGAIQLGREAAAEKAVGGLGYSSELVWALVGQTADRLKSLDLRGLVDLRKTRKLLVMAAGIAIVIAGCAVLAPGAVGKRYERLQDAYAAILDALFPVDMRVTPGDIAVVRGKPVTLGATLTGARRHNIRLLRTDLAGKQTDAEELVITQGSVSREITATDSFTYQFEYAGRRSASHRVLVGDLPDVSAINYEMAYPAYTGQASRTMSGRVPRLAALRGTGVLVSFAATTDLHPEYCYVLWQDGSRQAITTTGRFGHFAFSIAHGERASIHLTGSLGRGFEMAQPITFEVTVQEDEPPTIKIPLRNRKFTMLADEAAGFVVPWVAEDDFGVAEVNLEYKIDTIDELLGRAPRQSTVPRRIDPPQDRVKGTFAEVFKALNPPLQPGDRITITVSAKDNNTETGPSLGRSLPVEIVVVRPDLAGFVEQQYGFGGAGLLGGLKKLNRNTDLLIEPEKTVRTETAMKPEKAAVKSRVSQESWPSGSEDAVGSYFQLLSGQKQ